MLKPRLIPCLLIKDKHLVKTVRFKSPQYIGDPLNAVRIFNEKEVDEITIFDIDATSKGLDPDFKLIERLSRECQMPLCYGGGIKTISQIKQIISLGVEKISLSSIILSNPEFIMEAIEQVGSQSIVVTLDIYKGGLFNKETICSHNGKKSHKLDLFSFLNKVENYGAGELVINSINDDGLMSGYNKKLVESISKRTFFSELLIFFIFDLRLIIILFKSIFAWPTLCFEFWSILFLFLTTFLILRSSSFGSNGLQI